MNCSREPLRRTTMKQNRLLAGITLASVVLLALHISQDIVFGFDRAGLNHLVGGGILPAGMLPLHMRNGMRPEFLAKSGALLFIWTLYVLGVMGFLSMILAVRALVTRPSDGA